MLTTGKPLFDSVSLQCSALTTKKYSTSFSLGIRLLKKELRAPIHAIYGFVRFADEIVDTGAKTVLGGDLGCLMNIAGRLARRGEAVEARHIAEVLAERTDARPIGGDKA